MSGRAVANAVIVTAMLALAGLAWAQPGGPGGMPGMGGGAGGPGMEGGPCPGGGPGGDPGMPGAGGGSIGEPETLARFLERLDLTDEQRETIRDSLDETRESIEAIREESGLTEPGRDFLVLFSSPDLTEADLLDLAERAEAMRERIREVGIEAAVRIHDVLTDEQLEQIGEFAESDFRGMGNRPWRGSR